MEEEANLSRWSEAMEFLASSEDLATNQILNYANFIVLGHLKSGALPVARFDLLFFLETMKEFCANRDFLIKILKNYPVKGREGYEKINASRLLALDVLAMGWNSSIPITRAGLSHLSHHLDVSDETSSLRESNRDTVGLLRFYPAIELLDSVKDLPTSLIMHYANFTVLHHFLTRQEPLASHFDLLFFMEVMKEFRGNQEFLRKALAGEDLRWFAGDDDRRTNVA